jgi:predicted acyltransferase
MGTAISGQSRLASLDQFRGYTVLGMFVVNFLGDFDVFRDPYPWSLIRHHNTYCSYADTIMPQFFFAVGFAYRLTFLKRLPIAGPRATYLRAVRRNLGLILLGFVIYHLDSRVGSWSEVTQWARGLRDRPFSDWVTNLGQPFQRSLFQTLVHIGVTALWVMPVIAARPAVRVAFACFSGGLHLVLSYCFYYDWVMNRPGIDGGPLGFLTWTVPMLVGSLAYDVVAPGRSAPAAFAILGWGIVLMLVGYGLSCVNRVVLANSASLADHGSLLVEPPFVAPTWPVNMWTMSQRAGSLSYLTFAAGLSAALYALFILACDVGSVHLGVLRTLGTNALAGYIIHGLVDRALKPFAPKDAPYWYALAALGLFLAICYLFVRHLEKNQLYLRL